MKSTWTLSMDYRDFEQLLLFNKWNEYYKVETF